MDVFPAQKHWQCTQGYLCSFRKYLLDIHFGIHEIDGSLKYAASVTEFVAYSALFLCVCQLWQIHWLLKSSLTPENGGFEPFRETPKHVFYMIPSFKIDHSEITVLDSMNICTSQGVSNSYVIYHQLQCLKPNGVLKVHFQNVGYQ